MNEDETRFSTSALLALHPQLPNLAHQDAHEGPHGDPISTSRVTSPNGRSDRRRPPEFPLMPKSVRHAVSRLVEHAPRLLAAMSSFPALPVRQWLMCQFDGVGVGWVDVDDRLLSGRLLSSRAKQTHQKVQGGLVAAPGTLP